jgi:hypothetical protein
MSYDVRVVVNVVRTAPVVPEIYIKNRKSCIRIVYTKKIHSKGYFRENLLDRCYVEIKKNILINILWRVNVVG